MFCNSFSLLFFSSRDLRGPWADLREILPHGRKPLQMLVQKFGGLPPNNFERENTLILARFRTPSHFEREYLRKGQRYPKSENYVIDTVSSRVGRKKIGELWSTNDGDLEVQLYPENRIFRNTIFRPLGGAASRNFYTRYRISKSC